MSIDIRLPNITATDEAGKLKQIQSYMHQLVEQLNWALNNIDSVSGTPTKKPSTGASTASKDDPIDQFNSIKGLIIKSADIVKAYETTIFSDFNGKYFAESDFGTYIEETNRKVEENSKGVTDTFTQVQTITSDLTEVKQYVETTDGYIKRGVLADGSIGIEVGETTESGYHRYAQFTAERLTFYDVNGNPVAYIGAGDADKSDTNCLYVTGKAVFLGEIQLGGYKTDTSDGLAFTWIGG